MAYTKQNFEDGQILKAEHLNNIENGIEINSNDIQTINEQLANKTTEEYVNNKISELINSAPETLNTLGEIATAVKENDDVVIALNEAVGNKADKDHIHDDYVTESELESKGYITEIPEVKFEQVQSDWNESDESSPSYINNKPFGEAIVDHFILENAERTTSMINYDWGQGFNIEQEHADLIQSLANVPKNYRLTLDGEVNEGTFEGTSLRVSSEKHGNIEITPYWLLFENYYNDPVTLTIEFVISAVNVKKIDDKFLSDNVFTQPDWNQNDETALDYIKNRICYEASETRTILESAERTTVMFSEMGQIIEVPEEDMDILYNSTYSYKWTIDDEIFEGTKGDSTLVINSTKYGNIRVLPYGILFESHYSDPVTLTTELIIIIAGEVVKLDEKFLPDTVVFEDELIQPDWNQNDETAPDYIKNRICYEEESIVTVFDNITVTFNDSYGYSLTTEQQNIYSSNFTEMEKDENGNAYIDVIWNGKKYVGRGYFETEELMFVFTINTDEGTIQLYPRKFLISYDEGAEPTFNNTLSIYKKSGVSVTIPEKYLPDTVATKEYVDQAIGTALEGSY